MIERLRVRVPAGAVGEFSSPELTFGLDPHWCRSTPYYRDDGSFLADENCWEG